METDDLPFRDVCAFEEVPDGAYITREVDGAAVLIAREGETAHVVENLCSHARAKFDGGVFRRGEITCPLHGARFCVRTGEHRGPPAFKPIAAFPTRVVEGRVQAKIPEGAGQNRPAPGFSPF